METTENTTSSGQGHRMVIVSPVLLIGIITLAVVIVISNLIALAVMAVSRKLRSNNHHVLVLFLGFSDIMVGLGLVFSMLAIMYDSLLDKRAGCLFSLVLLIASLAASFLQMLLLCVERFVSIRFAFKLEKIFGGKKKYIYLILAWIISYIYFITIFNVLAKADVNECGIRGIFNAGDQSKLMLSVVGFFFVVYVSTVCLYLHTICLIRRVTRRIKDIPRAGNRDMDNTNKALDPRTEKKELSMGKSTVSSNTEHGSNTNNLQQHELSFLQVQPLSSVNIEGTFCHIHPSSCSGISRATVRSTSHKARETSYNRLKLEKKATVTVGCILGLLTVCVLPITIIETFGQLDLIDISGNLRTIAGTLMALNSLTNPVLFSLRIKEFRTELRRIFRC